MKTFFSSDFHFGQINICKGTTVWEDGWRDFENPNEMDEELLENINKMIGENDVLYYNGDFAFGGIKNIPKYRKLIRCKTIHYILGNHDQHIRSNKIVDGIPLKSLFTSVQEVLEKKINGQRMFLSHYAHRVWDKSHYGSVHLYGHSHDSLDVHGYYGRSMDIGIDSAFRLKGKYKPFSFEEVMDIMNSRPIKYVDHHIKER